MGKKTIVELSNQDILLGNDEFPFWRTQTGVTSRISFDEIKQALGLNTAPNIFTANISTGTSTIDFKSYDIFNLTVNNDFQLNALLTGGEYFEENKLYYVSIEPTQAVTISFGSQLNTSDITTSEPVIIAFLAIGVDKAFSIAASNILSSNPSQDLLLRTDSGNVLIGDDDDYAQFTGGGSDITLRATNVEYGRINGKNEISVGGTVSALAVVGKSKAADRVGLGLSGTTTDDTGSTPVVIISGGQPSAVLANRPVVSVRNFDQELARFDANGDFLVNNLAGAGSRMVIVDANGILSTQALPSGGVVFPILADDGTEAAPSYGFSNDNDSGFWFDSGSTKLNATVGGTTRWGINSSGNLEIAGTEYLTSAGALTVTSVQAGSITADGITLGDASIAGNKSITVASSSVNANIQIVPKGTGTIQGPIGMEGNISSGQDLINLAYFNANQSAVGDASSVTVVASGNLGSTNAQSALVELQGDIDNINTAIGIAIDTSDLGVFTGSIISDNISVKSALQEIENSIESLNFTTSTDGVTISGDGQSTPLSFIGSASNIPVTPVGNLGSMNVQAALQELQGDVDALAASGFTGTYTLDDPSTNSIIKVAEFNRTSPSAAESGFGGSIEIGVQNDNSENIPLAISHSLGQVTDGNEYSEFIVTGYVGGSIGNLIGIRTSSISYGWGNTVTNSNSNMAFGINNSATGGIGLVIGSGSSANGNPSIAVGLTATANESHALAMGNLSKSAQYGVSIGSNAGNGIGAGNPFAVVTIGFAANNTGVPGARSVAIGNAAHSLGDFSGAYGENMVADAQGAIMMGYGNLAARTNSIADSFEINFGGNQAFKTGLTTGTIILNDSDHVTNITNPQNGSMVYNTTSHDAFIRVNGSWVSILGGGSGFTGSYGVSDSDVDTSIKIAEFNRNTSGTGAAGIGGYIEIGVEDDSDTLIPLKIEHSLINAAIGSSEFKVIGSSSGIDRRFITINGNNITTIGFNAGQSTGTINSGSTSIGANVNATALDVGSNSTAVGNGSRSPGTQSLAAGYAVDALGNYSIAIGSQIDASGTGSIIVGSATGPLGTLVQDNNIDYSFLVTFGSSRIFNAGYTIGTAITVSSDPDTLLTDAVNGSLAYDSDDHDVRALVNGTWVSLLGAGSFTLQNGNGTVANESAVDLGGSLNADTQIVLGTNRFELNTDASDTSNRSGLNIQTTGGNTLSEITSQVGSTSERSYIQSSSIPGTSTHTARISNQSAAQGGLKEIILSNTLNGVTVIDGQDTTGLYYQADYSTNGELNHGDRWIPDRGWVNAAIAAAGVGGAVSSITNEADNRILTGTGTPGVINAEEFLTFDGTTFVAPRIQVDNIIIDGDVIANGSGSITIQANGGELYLSNLNNVGLADDDKVLIRDTSDTDMVKEVNVSEFRRAKIKEETGTTYTLTEADNGYYIFFTNPAGCSVTLPDGLSIGHQCVLFNDNTGTLSLSATTTLKGANSMSVDGGSITSIHKGSNIFYGV